MTKAKSSKKPSASRADEASAEEQGKSLKNAGNDPAVKQALRKEEQPSKPGDLSPIHNTKEMGTSGGDQREKEIRPNDGE